MFEVAILIKLCSLRVNICIFLNLISYSKLNFLSLKCIYLNALSEVINHKILGVHRFRQTMRSKKNSEYCNVDDDLGE